MNCRICKQPFRDDEASGDRFDGEVRHLYVNDCVAATARRCAEIAWERCRLLNGDASAMNRKGRHEMAAAAEMKADQFVWMADAIEREFNLKEPPK